MASHRSDRVAGLLQREVGRILDARLTDPRLGKLVTVSHVTVTPDLAYATIAVTVMGDMTDAVEAMQGLESAAGFLRREIGQRLGLKRAPELRFVRDASIEQGDHVLDLLDTLKTEVRDSRSLRHSRESGNSGTQPPPPSWGRAGEGARLRGRAPAAGEAPFAIPAQAGTPESPPPLRGGLRSQPNDPARD